MKTNLNAIDPTIFELINDEYKRQQSTIDLIASENYAPPAVLEATGSILTNKYAEGYPNKRYYQGCEFVDKVEQIAIDRCKELFNAEHANVQPHAGSQANFAALYALVQPGETIMGMSLAEGGHLTHGHSVNFSGKIYKSVQYTVNKETGLLDYDAIEKLAVEHKPKLIIAGASAYSRFIDFERFVHIAKKINAFFMADIAHIAGLIAANLHPSPIPYADVVTSTTHKTLRGPRGGLIMCKKDHASKIDRAIMPGTQGGPFLNSIAAKAVSFHLALQNDFKQYQQHVITNAKTMVTEFLKKNYTIVTGGTDNHLFVLDLRNKNIKGNDASSLLASVGIVVSQSCIPFDPEKPTVTSGIRIGTPAVTTRNMKEAEMIQIVDLIDRTFVNRDNTQILNDIKTQVLQLALQFKINE